MPAETEQSTALSQAEQAALTRVRERFNTDHDLFDPREMAYLQFLRWLVRSGQLTVS